ncbi:hypothetical protein CSAL01_01718 [Colletotrichum salicis]|uniref:Uncharacterized protein n=1 Tax=Colletotrichum salicis TaxID=1209931 RepID=A0A135V949_9PEZI|nr:hypothetical protein CSAL01_01718 [Colletotrichum salicis]
MNFSIPSEQCEDLDSPSMVLTELPGSEGSMLIPSDPVTQVDFLTQTDQFSALFLDQTFQDIDAELPCYPGTDHLVQPTEYPIYNEDEVHIHYTGHTAHNPVIDNEHSYDTQSQPMMDNPDSTVQSCDLSNLEGDIWNALDDPTPTT